MVQSIFSMFHRSLGRNGGKSLKKKEIFKFIRKNGLVLDDYNTEMNCKYNEIDGYWRIFRLPSVTGKLTNALVNLKNNNNKNNKHRTYRVLLGHLYFFQCNWLKACFLFCDVTAEK